MKVQDIIKGNLQHLIGQNMIIIDEPEVEGMTKSDAVTFTSFLKNVTGGGDVSISVKYAGNHVGRISGQIWVTTNPMLTGRDSTGTFASRLVGNIHGQSWEGKEDLALSDKLQTPAEMSGVLRLALIGLRRVRRREKFTLTDGTVRMQTVARGVGSTFLEWVSERVVITGDKSDAQTIKELYGDYCEFCKNAGCGAKKKSGLVAELLQNKKIEYQGDKPGRINGKLGRFYTGIKLRPVEVEPDDGGVVEFQRISSRYGTNFRRN